MISKSLLTQSVSVGNRSLTNPMISTATISSSSAVSVNATFTNETYIALKAIQELYTFNLASKTYENIPTDYNKFLYLYRTVHTTYQNTTNPNLRLLFQITEDGLIGAINSFDLNYLNNELSQRNTELQSTINDLISKVNVKTAITSDTGNVSFQKSFTLAPLFSYYIVLYGMPPAGVGFDQEKLSNLLYIMEQNNIDPYAG
jgi:hypothetical protein